MQYNRHMERTKPPKKRPQPNQYRARLGPYSPTPRLLKIDQRTTMGYMVKHLRSNLIKHCGGKASVVQIALIEIACTLSLRVAMLNQKMVAGDNFTEIDNNCYLAWTNALTRTLSRLGTKSKERFGRDEPDDEYPYDERLATRASDRPPPQRIMREADYRGGR